MYNAWWLPLIYGLVTMMVMSRIPKEKKQRILTMPDASVLVKISFLTGKALIIVSIFVPITNQLQTLIIGGGIYLIGMILSVYAMWYFSKADLSKPVTGSIYRITRHPMQVMSFIMWIGISMMTQSLLLSLLTMLYMISSNEAFKMQEAFCLDKYQDEYMIYLKKTPRYLFF